jgi:hypothetical protein
MNKNVASWDRIIRAVLGVVLLYVGIAGLVSGWLGVVIAILGAVFLVTSLIGFCPIYAVFKLSTKKA